MSGSSDLTTSYDSARQCLEGIGPLPQIPAEGVTGTFLVYACDAWNLATNVPWIRFEPASGVGNATVTITVLPNIDNGERSGLIYYPGGSVSIVQPPPGSSPPGCTYALSRKVFSVPAIGDVVGLGVTASAAACTWTATPGVPWITVGPASTPGSGPLQLTVATNPGATPRTGTVTAAGETITLIQGAAGCSFTLASQSATAPASGGQFQVAVNTNAGCSWTPAPAPDWITIPSGANPNVGPATLTYIVATNSGARPRTGAISVGGQLLQIIQLAASPETAFQDVALNHPFANFIDLMKSSSISTGCTSANYCPEADTTRGEMAVFIIRGLLGTNDFPYEQAPYFTDVGAGHPFFKFIQKMRELGITTGCTVTTYCPNDPVTRGQMAVFIVRARLGIASGTTFPFTQTPFFTDVGGTYPFFSFIQKMRELGITTGCTATTYCPGDSTTRGQMSVFIIRGLKTP